MLTSVLGKRVEVQPAVAVGAGVANRCNASAEVFDNLLGINSVAVPGAIGFPPDPLFGMIGVTELQTVRVNVVAFPPDPCVGQLSFLNSQGAPAGSALEVQLAPGQAASLDLPGSALVTKLGQRAEVQRVVTAPRPTEDASPRPRSISTAWAQLRSITRPARALRRAPAASSPEGLSIQIGQAVLWA